jgi:hypothetical protein
MPTGMDCVSVQTPCPRAHDEASDADLCGYHSSHPSVALVTIEVFFVTAAARLDK